LKYTGKAFAPSFIPLFFSFERSKLIEDCGFTGAGISLIRGVSCIARVEPSNCVKLNMVYGKRQLNLPWIEEAVRRMLENSEIKGVRGLLDFNFEVPVSLDLSIATASIVSALAAIHSALKLDLNPLGVGDIAHRIEIEYEIGCGTTLPQLIGGVTLLEKAGSPSRAKYVKLTSPEELKVVVGGPASAQVVFKKYNWEALSLKWSDVSRLTSMCDFDEIVSLARNFTAEMMGVFRGSSEVLSELGKLRPVAYGFSFDGKTVYVLVHKEDVVKFVDLLLDFFPCEGIVVTEVDHLGTRVYE